MILTSILPVIMGINSCHALDDGSHNIVDNETVNTIHSQSFGKATCAGLVGMNIMLIICRS